jgi:hypothetical protein
VSGYVRERDRRSRKTRRGERSEHAPKLPLFRGRFWKKGLTVANVHSEVVGEREESGTNVSQ